MDKREQIKKYFKPFPKWAVWMIIIGLPFLYFYGLGLVLIGIGIWALVDSTKKPSDAQMDAWLEEDLKVLHGKALSKTGTDASELVGEPVMVTGPRFWDIAGAGWAFKKGKDNSSAVHAGGRHGVELHSEPAHLLLSRARSYNRECP